MQECRHDERLFRTLVRSDYQDERRVGEMLVSNDRCGITEANRQPKDQLAQDPVKILLHFTPLRVLVCQGHSRKTLAVHTPIVLPLKQGCNHKLYQIIDDVDVGGGLQLANEQYGGQQAVAPFQVRLGLSRYREVSRHAQARLEIQLR